MIATGAGTAVFLENDVRFASKLLGATAGIPIGVVAAFALNNTIRDIDLGAPNGPDLRVFIEE